MLTFVFSAPVRSARITCIVKITTIPLIASGDFTCKQPIQPHRNPLDDEVEEGRPSS